MKRPDWDTPEWRAEVTFRARMIAAIVVPVLLGWSLYRLLW